MAIKSMIFVMLIGLLACCNAETFELSIQKRLNNADRIEDKLKYFNIALITDEDGTKMSAEFDFDFALTDDLEGYVVSATTLYFANDELQIAEITFLDGAMTLVDWKKPWNLAVGNNKRVPADTVKPNKANVEIPFPWIPYGVNAVSGSVEVKKGDEVVLFNYYGIKNYLISYQDTYVVGNYKKVNFMLNKN